MTLKPATAGKLAKALELKSIPFGHEKTASYGKRFFHLLGAKRVRLALNTHPCGGFLAGQLSCRLACLGRPETAHKHRAGFASHPIRHS